MKKVKITRQLGRVDFLRTHIRLVDALEGRKLTDREIEVLAAFAELEGDIRKDILGTSARKIVKDKLGLSAPGLANYLKSLSEKEVIKEGKISPVIFLPSGEEVSYQINLIPDEKD